MRDTGFQDSTSSNGNMPLFKQRQEKPPLQAEQLVSIPIYIRNSKKEKQAPQTETINTTVCEVSGCSFQILIPKTVTGLNFKWESPLASAKNAMQIANMPKMKLVELPPEILAGTAISLLNSRNLLVGKSSSSDVNQALVTFFTNIELVENIVKIKKIVETISKKELPLLSKDNFDKDSFKQFLLDVLLVLFPVREQPALEAATIKIRIKETITKSFDLTDENEITSLVDGEKDFAPARVLQEWLLRKRKTT